MSSSVKHLGAQSIFSSLKKSFIALKNVLAHQQAPEMTGPGLILLAWAGAGLHED